jgi:group II intron reverse transcriptase/maturase
LIKAKPFSIAKREVWEAYKRVRANKGAAGVDGQSIDEFEKDLSNNLYKLWNRMSSGSYFPPPVRKVDIPKPDGRMRPLGIPTVADRVAQMVAKQRLEPEVEPHFHPDSYGYRPGKSAIEAVGQARKRCWHYYWVVDLDIKSFFDTIDHELLMQAVRKHTNCKWILLYVKRWLKAPSQLINGTLLERNKGTPQGGVISPLLANLFLHYAFDKWMDRMFPNIPFERYADDVLCHCVSEKQAKYLLNAIGLRFARCRLELNLQKIKIVYCKDDNRWGNYSNESFDFLGFTFRPRLSETCHGNYFVNFSPAMSNKAAKEMRQTIRSWRLHRRSDKSLQDFARMLNPIIRGWINYYGSYYKSALYPAFQHLDWILSRWAMRKYKRLRKRQRKAKHWLRRIRSQQPWLFAHWNLLYSRAGR